MNHSIKIILVVATISLATIFSVSYVHAQMVSFGSSNSSSVQSQPLTFGYSNATHVNPTHTLGSATVNNSTLSTTPDPCIRSAELQIHSITSSFNITKAASLANAHMEFKSRVAGYDYAFDSNFDTWNLNKTSCTLTWKTTNMVYDLRNTTGIVKRVVVTEDPSLTRVLNVTEQHQTEHFSSVLNSSNWSGYEFAGDGSIPPTTKMYNSYSTFTVPAITIPSYPSFSCRSDLGNPPCVLATWVGLENTAGAPDNILAQTGAVGNITCTSSSCIKYSIFYEFLGNGPSGAPVYCTGLNQVSASDSITANVYNDTIVGGTHSNRIDIFTVDNTNHNANTCTTFRDSYFTTTPIYSSFINEGPIWATLPQFSSVQMKQNTVYYGNSYRYISQPYSNGWFNEHNFFNIGDTSITNHDPTGQNFTETWNTNCLPPLSGDWTVSSSCTLNSNYNASGNVIVPNGFVLRVPWSKILTIDFLHHNLQVNSGGGVLVDGLSNPAHPTWLGGAIK